jgi:hypothetical protein
LRMQKKFVVKEARLHEPKAIRWMTGWIIPAFWG